jgi:hypothetical protein
VNRSITWLGVFILARGVGVAAAEPGRSAWVYPGADGRLVYKTTSAGDRIMDFSYAGYVGGGVPLPSVAAKRTVKPSGGEDDTAAIQKAIDELSAMPVENGVRGAVLLGPGTFNCAGTITISTSGVALRGGGTGANDGERTTIKLVGKPHLAIAVRAAGGQGGHGAAESADGAKTSIADEYVPSGSMSFSVLDASVFAAGDTISIRRPVTAAWIKFMGMDDLVRDGKPQTWLRAGNTTNTERRIAHIDGKRITVDVPLSDSFDAKYLNPPGTSIVKIRPPAQLSQVGIENLRIESPPQEINHTQPHFTALRLNGEDCWARDVTIDETMNSVAVSGRRITLQRVSVHRKAKHQGASKPAEFAPNGTQVLLDRCSVRADNVWFVATGSGVAGPVVVLNCTFEGAGRAESHQRWSTGLLYDNCRAAGGGIEMRNRGAMGSGHGWTMGWGVLWNCEAKDYLLQNPPGAMNWMIGCVGASESAARPFGTEPRLPGGTEDSTGARVEPKSLYLAQLAERLGPEAIKRIGY